MPGSNLRVERIGVMDWLFTWSGTAPFRIYRGGVLVEQSSRTSLIVHNESRTEPPVIEVLDALDASLPQQIEYPATMTLQWKGNPDAFLYVVEQYVSGEWVQRRTVKDRGQAMHQFTTPTCPDCQVSHWRVVALDQWTYRSVPVDFEAFVVRNPDTPDVVATYDGEAVVLEDVNA